MREHLSVESFVRLQPALQLAIAVELRCAMHVHSPRDDEFAIDVAMHSRGL